MRQIDNQNEQQSLSITIVCLNAAGVIFKRVEKNIGGMELRAWTLAKALAKQQATHVRFVVRDIHENRQVVDSVDVVPFESRWSRAVSELSPYLTRTYSFPWLKINRWSPLLLTGLFKMVTLKLFSPSEKQTTFNQTLSNTNADLFVAFGVSYYTRFTIEFARQQNKPSVLMIASDDDLNELNRPGTGYISPFGDRADDTWWLIQHADQIFVQTAEQQAMLKERFGRDGIVLENPIDLDWWREESQRTDLLPDNLKQCARAWLWVGRSERQYKQPQLLVQLAKECPEERFLMILNPRDLELDAEVRRDAPANVTIVESIPYELMPAVFNQSKGLITTSRQEGFPNTLLQAAACGRPIVSLNVADVFLKSSKAGTCANGDWATFVNLIKSPISPPIQTQDYLQQHHSLTAITNRYRTSLSQLPKTFHHSSSAHQARAV